jgi:hypothetical protein
MEPGTDVNLGLGEACDEDNEVLLQLEIPQQQTSLIAANAKKAQKKQIELTDVVQSRVSEISEVESPKSVH